MCVVPGGGERRCHPGQSNGLCQRLCSVVTIRGRASGMYPQDDPRDRGRHGRMGMHDVDLALQQEAS